MGGKCKDVVGTFAVEVAVAERKRHVKTKGFLTKHFQYRNECFSRRILCFNGKVVYQNVAQDYPFSRLVVVLSPLENRFYNAFFLEYVT